MGTGNLEPTEESVNVENERLVLTVDPCLGDPEMVEFVPLSATDRVPAIKMEVVCNVSGENYTMPKGHFEFDKTLEVTGLSSSTEYKCVARLFKDDGSSSGWSKELSVSTVETGEEAQTFPPTEAPESRSAGPSEPKSTNGGNLTFGSFISLAALVSTTLLLTTNHFF